MSSRLAASSLRESTIYGSLPFLVVIHLHVHASPDANPCLVLCAFPECDLRPKAVVLVVVVVVIIVVVVVDS